MKMTTRIAFDNMKYHKSRNILIGIDTGNVSVEEKEKEIRVHVDYILEANYQYLADCKIEMKISPREEGLRLL